MNDRDRFDLIDQEQLAAQVVAVMDAHFQRLSAENKIDVLRRAGDQIRSSVVIRQAPLASQAVSQEP